MPNIGDYPFQIYILQRWHYSEGYTTAARNARTLGQLKVPKCEIFDRSDFPDFYTIKSRPEGDFGVKIKKF